MSESSLSWGCCGLDNSEEEYICCSQCGHAYHINCLNPNGNTSDFEVVSDWKCPACKPVRRSLNKDVTPARQHGLNPIERNASKRPNKRMALSSPSEQKESAAYMTHNDIRDLVKEVIKSELKTAISNMSETFTNEMRAVKDEMRNMRDSMSFINIQYEEIIKQNNINSEIIKNLQSEAVDMRSTITNLNNRINQIEQATRANNLEVQCVPETNGENTFEMIQKIGNAIGYSISESSVTHCIRTAKINRSSSRPRSIVVQFNSRKTRDSFMAAAIKFNRSNPHDKLNTVSAGISNIKRPIYITEHLSPANKALHAAARSRAKALNYKYVWVRDGRIFVRKDDGANYNLIKSIDCINNLV